MHITVYAACPSHLVGQTNYIRISGLGIYRTIAGFQLFVAISVIISGDGDTLVDIPLIILFSMVCVFRLRHLFLDC